MVKKKGSNKKIVRRNIHVKKRGKIISKTRKIVKIVGVPTNKTERELAEFRKKLLKKEFKLESKPKIDPYSFLKIDVFGVGFIKRKGILSFRYGNFEERWVLAL